MSSVARCYTPLKTNIYIKPKLDQYEFRRDSFEIGVFDASNYYSSLMESTFTDANIADCVQDANIADCVQDDDHHLVKRHTSNLVPSYGQEEPKKKKKSVKNKKLQPSSPGAKIASYLHAILNQTTPVSKPKKNKSVFSEDDRKSSRSSSMSLARCVDVSEAASVHSCPSYPRRPTSTLTLGHARAVKPGYNELRSYSSCSSKRSLVDAETLGARTGRSWPALTWFDQELKIRKEVSYDVKGLKKVKEEDGTESDSSSDLFELRNCDLKVQRGFGELPVHRTTYQHEQQHQISKIVAP